MIMETVKLISIKGSGSRWEVDFSGSISIRELRLIERSLAVSFKCYNRKRALESRKKVKVEDAGRESGRVAGLSEGQGKVGEGVKPTGNVGGNPAVSRQVGNTSTSPVGPTGKGDNGGKKEGAGGGGKAS